jgi:hypothetical protein
MMRLAQDKLRLLSPVFRLLYSFLNRLSASAAATLALNLAKASIKQDVVRDL